MESSKFNSADNATFAIQVNPQVVQNTGQQVIRAYNNTALTKFFKAEPKALGTVQIMIGVVGFLFGIVRATILYYPAVLTFSGITFWGSFIYISAGSLSVAAQNKLHPCVVKASLGMNVISAITAGIAIVLTSMQIILGSFPYERCYYDYYSHYNSPDSHYAKDMCFFLKYDLGISGILLVFSILQFIISICISGFACKATCPTDSTVVNVALNQGY